MDNSQVEEARQTILEQAEKEKLIPNSMSFRDTWGHYGDIMDIESPYIVLAWLGIGLGFIGLVLVVADMIKMIRDER